MSVPYKHKKVTVGVDICHSHSSVGSVVTASLVLMPFPPPVVGDLVMCDYVR